MGCLACVFDREPLKALLIVVCLLVSNEIGYVIFKGITAWHDMVQCVSNEQRDRITSAERLEEQHGEQRVRTRMGQSRD